MMGHMVIHYFKAIQATETRANSTDKSAVKDCIGQLTRQSPERQGARAQTGERRRVCAFGDASQLPMGCAHRALPDAYCARNLNPSVQTRPRDALLCQGTLPHGPSVIRSAL